jgi:branched-chain amino acid transport system permease protein
MRDRQLEVIELFDRGARQRTAALLTDDVIAEHAANPSGPHGDALQRVLRYFRRAPIPGKFLIVAVRPWAEYRVAALTGVRGEAPVLLDDGPYPTEAEAMHAVFLHRVEQLRADQARADQARAGQERAGRA